MSLKRYVLLSTAVLAVGAGAAGAVAATSRQDPKQVEQSILADAAQRLKVSPDDLRSALGAAEDAQLDQAVKDGRLTQQQADAIKAERQKDGRVLGFGGGPGHGPGERHFGFGFGRPGGPGGPGGGDVLDAAAGALGLQPAELRTQLAAGKSVADVAKDRGKSVDDVKSAVKAAVTKRLDAAVTAGRITADERQHELDELDGHLDDLVTATPGLRGGARGARRGHWR